MNMVDKNCVLNEYARCWNEYKLGHFDECLSASFRYTLFWVYDELDKEGYLEYFAGKLANLKESHSDVKANIVNGTLVVTQGGTNVVIDVEFSEGKITRACMMPASFFGIPDNGNVL